MKRMCSRWYSSARSGCFSRRCANAFSTRSSSSSPRIISPHGQASLVFISGSLGSTAVSVDVTRRSGTSAVLEDEAPPLPGVPDVLVLTPRPHPVELPLGEAGPVEHVWVGVEHASAGRAADGVKRAAARVDRVDGDQRRPALVVALDRTRAVDQRRPLAVAQQVAAQDTVVALAVDRDAQEAVVD